VNEIMDTAVCGPHATLKKRYGGAPDDVLWKPFENAKEGAVLFARRRVS